MTPRLEAQQVPGGGHARLPPRLKQVGADQAGAQGLGGPGWFTLAAEATWSPGTFEPALSTEVRSEWRFRSGAGTGERAALPLLDVRYALGLDDRNTADGPVRGTVSAAHQPGSPSAGVRSLGVEVSFDDGATWRQVPVRGGKIEIPDGPAGFASLRASATDALGNSVTETIIRAYAVR